MVLSACQNLKHKAMIALGYGSGLRVSEICALRVQDIDSKQMRVFVRCGKRNKDRYTILSQKQNREKYGCNKADSYAQASATTSHIRPAAPHPGI